MELVDQFKLLVCGYYGVKLIDEYPLKEYILNDIENYIKEYFEINPISNFNYSEEALYIRDKIGDKTKLQDALIVMNKVNAPMDLVFMVKKRLKQLSGK